MDFLNVLPLVVAESNAGAAIGALIGGLIGLACSLVVLVAYWKLFVKMGEPGCTALFPFSTHGTSSSTSSVMVG